MLSYNGTIYRPPLEAYTLLLPVTEGCSHNRCKFCNMYRDVKFRMLDLSEIEAWLAEVAGKGRGAENAVATAELLNDIKPDKILINTMTAFDDTELAAEVQAGNFTAAGETENLTEEKILVENLDLPDTYFWAAHSMNSVPIAGYLRDSREQMISTLDHAIANMNDKLFSKTFRRTHL